MKTKTDAAKALLEAGWEWDEIHAVLDGERTEFVPMPYPIQPVQPQPNWWVDPAPWWYQPTITTSDSISITSNGEATNGVRTN